MYLMSLSINFMHICSIKVFKNEILLTPDFETVVYIHTHTPLSLWLSLFYKCAAAQVCEVWMWVCYISWEMAVGLATTPFTTGLVCLFLVWIYITFYASFVFCGNAAACVKFYTDWSKQKKSLLYVGLANKPVDTYSYFFLHCSVWIND